MQTHVAPYIGQGVVIRAPIVDGAANQPLVFGGDGTTLPGSSTDIRTFLGLDTNDAVTFGNLTVNDLVVNGTTTTINSVTLTVDDPLIRLADNNGADSLDIGFYGKYLSSGDKFTGLFRDASDGKYRLFTGLEEEPTTTVNLAGAGYTVGSLVANIEGNLIGNVNGVELTTGGVSTQFLNGTGAYSTPDHDALTNFVANEHIDHTGIQIATQHSLTGGGTIAATRTLNLVGDTAIPGNSKYYGTDGSGTRGFFDLPSGGGVTDHGALTGLVDDDHTQYALLAGRSGGQSLVGGTGSGENLLLQSTSHGTKGNVLFGGSSNIGYDNTNNRFGFGSSLGDARIGITGGGVFEVCRSTVGTMHVGINANGNTTLALYSNNVGTSGTASFTVECGLQSILNCNQFGTGIRSGNNGISLQLGLLTIGTAGSHGTLALPPSSSLSALAVRGLSSQTAPLQVWQNNTPTTLLEVSPSGVLKGPDGVSADSAGSNTVISGGAGRGNGTPGDILFQTSTVGTTGSTLQTQSTRLTASSYGITVNGGEIRFAVSSYDSIRAISGGGLQFTVAGSTRVGRYGSNGWIFGNNGTVDISAPTYALEARKASSGTAVDTVLAVTNTMTSGTASNGFGVSTVFRLRNANGTEKDAGRLDFIWADATHTSEDTDYAMNLMVGGTLTEVWRISGGAITPRDGANIVLGTTTGMKIGTGATQKLGFWNATPVVQQVLATGAGATVDNVISFLQTIGLCKQS